MADILLDTQGVPTAPAVGSTLIYPNSNKRITSTDENGLDLTLHPLYNANTADVVANAADTYLTGSSIAIPSHLLQAGAIFRWRFGVTKSAAGVAAPIWVVRVGTLGTVVDAARLTFTQVALQTAAVDAAFIDIDVVLRNIGAAGVLAGVLKMNHVLAATGFSTLTMNVLQVTSAGFDTTTASLIIGVSVNPGAAGVWTHQVVTAQALGI